jgi:Glycosyltransferases involved in cell wall biogenesis
MKTEKMKICVLIPVYNSEKLIVNVIESVLQYAENVIIVNDGSTDGTIDVLSSTQAKNPDKIEIVSYNKNAGKGYALRKGFDFAESRGFTHVITIDADGQHKGKDLPKFFSEAVQNPDALLIGTRNFNNPNMPQGNLFANRFSNFWFTLQTGKKLADTQTGFRLYPLKRMNKMRSLTKRYEAELELLVRSAWRNIKILPVEIDVYYPPINERVSFFRPRKDFFRISVLNTVLCFAAVLYGYPSMFLRKK